MSARCYQKKVISKAIELLLQNVSVCIVLGTGTGKTYCFSAIVDELNRPSAVVVHRKEIVTQISLSLAKFGVQHRIVASESVQTRIRRKHLAKYNKSYIDHNSLNGVCMAQTLASKSSENDRELRKWANQVQLKVYDEGHHYVKKGSWAKAVNFFPNAMHLSVTACPERADGRGLGSHAEGFVDQIVEGPPTRWMIQQGYLSPYSYFTPDSDLNTENIPLNANGDLNVNILRKRVVESKLVGDVVKHYRKYANGKQVIVFATDVATAKEIKASFSQSGVISEVVHGGDIDSFRDDALDRFEAKKIQVLINVDLFDEGFDVPGMDGVILARPTESLNKFLQMIGRALRPVYADNWPLETKEQRLAAIAASIKPKAIIIDPVRNWERHWLPCWPRTWTLDSREKKVSKAGALILKKCLGCTQPFERYLSVCPYCGYEEVRAGGGAMHVEQVDGDLTALDPEAFYKLHQVREYANMSDEDYRQNQIERNIPPIGRAADMRRFKATKTRRKVLECFVSHWLQLHRGKDQAEVQKRFYLQFGVDMITAHTLNEKDTDLLIQKIKEQFI